MKRTALHLASKAIRRLLLYNTTSVEIDTPILLYTSRPLTQQGLVPLSLDHLVLEMLRITPFLARGFCDTN